MMSEAIDVAEVAAKVLEALQRRRARATDAPPRPIPGLVLARCYGIRPHGSPDSRKRGARLVVDHLRRLGHPIVSDFTGYWLSGGVRDDAEYQAFRKRMGLGHLAAASAVQRSDAHADATGQLRLPGVS